MAAVKYVKKDDLTKWVQELAGSRRVMAPVEEGDAVVFRDYEAGHELAFRKQATAPPKDAVFPAGETLMEYAYIKDPEDPEKVELQVKGDLPDDKTVVFGCRPCDARGFVIFDRVYMNEDRIVDPYYKARRENTAFVSLACEEKTNACFCHWVGSGPGDTLGSDVQLIPVNGGYVVKAISEKGEELMSSSLLGDAGAHAAAADEALKKADEAMGDAHDFSNAPEKLLERFDDVDFWERMSAKCISCGACTYLCPTCYCFNITDENTGTSGRRVRSWDNCMSFLFTLEGSGHNPRTTKAHRWRNRAGHKFSYYPDLHERIYACCGCGRCIKSCPTSVDIREIVKSAQQHTSEG